jgi:dCTP deaminase
MLPWEKRSLYMLLSDVDIKELCSLCNKKGMITPFTEKQVRKTEYGEKVISYGLSSSGYDVRLGTLFKIPHDNKDSILDVLHTSDGDYESLESLAVVVRPSSYILGCSVEYFRMPTNIMGLCQGKSSLARCGINVPVTPIEPGWEGQLTIEIFNAGPRPVKLHAYQGIIQVVFFQLSSHVKTPYTYGRKYQGQTGVTVTKV